MITGSDGHFWSFGRGVAVLGALLAAWLIAATPASAQTPPAGAMFVHSAKSGELGGGRLMLHGVSGRVTWAHHSGRSGVVALTRMHRQLFSARTPAATGTLHVAGNRGGDELTFRLSKPRYNASRRTVSYAVKRMKGRLPSRAAGRGRGRADVRCGVAVDRRRSADDRRSLDTTPDEHLRLSERSSRSHVLRDRLRVGPGGWHRGQLVHRRYLAAHQQLHNGPERQLGSHAAGDGVRKRECDQRQRPSAQRHDGRGQRKRAVLDGRHVPHRGSVPLRHD